MARSGELSDEVVYRGAELFCGDPELSASDLADRLNEQFRVQPKLSRESAYELICEARARRFVRLVPPMAPELSEALGRAFGHDPARIHVVNSVNRASNSFVASAAAGL